MRRVVAPLAFIVFAVVACAGGTGTRFDKADAGPDAGTATPDAGETCDTEARVVALALPDDFDLDAVTVANGRIYFSSSGNIDNRAHSRIDWMPLDGGTQTLVTEQPSPWIHDLRVDGEAVWATMDVRDDGERVARFEAGAEPVVFDKADEWTIEPPVRALEGDEVIVRAGKVVDTRWMPALLAVKKDGSSVRVLASGEEISGVLYAEPVDGHVWFYGANGVTRRPYAGGEPVTVVADVACVIRVKTNATHFACIEESDFGTFRVFTRAGEELPSIDLVSGVERDDLSLVGSAFEGLRRPVGEPASIVRLDAEGLTELTCGVPPRGTLLPDLYLGWERGDRSLAIIER